MNPDIQNILVTMVGLLLTALLGLITWALPKIIELIKAYIQAKIDQAESTMTATDRAIFNDIVIKAVQDAEQRGQIKDILNTATAKKDYALKAVQAELDRLKIPFDLNAADRMIEAVINQNLEHPTPKLIQGESIKLAPITSISSIK